MRTNANAGRARRRHIRTLVLAMALVAVPSVQARAEDPSSDAARIYLLRQQWFDERAQLESQLLALRQTIARQRAADAAQQRALDASVEQLRALEVSLRAETADRERSNIIAWSLTGLALLLAGGIAVLGSNRAIRTQGREFRTQLDAITRRHADEQNALRAALQNDLRQARAVPATTAAPMQASTGTQVRAEQAATLRSDSLAATVRSVPTQAAIARHDDLPVPPGASARVEPTVTASSAQAAANPPFAADQRIVLNAPLVTLQPTAAGALQIGASAGVADLAPDDLDVAAQGPGAATLAVPAAQATSPRGVDIEMVYDPTSLEIVEEPGTSPDEADARWRSLTGAPLTQIELQPATPQLPRSALRGNLTMENHSGTFAASHANLANTSVRQPADGSAATPRMGGSTGDGTDLAAAGDTDDRREFAQTGASRPDMPEMDTLDPSRLSLTSHAGRAQAELRARLMELELQDDLRRQLNAEPELLRGLVEEALGVVLVPTSARTFEDWRLLVLDAWRRDNMQEALARTDSMVASATTDGDRMRAHMHRALVVDRMERLGAGATTARQDTTFANLHATALAPARSLAAMLREAVRLRREERDTAAASRLLTELIGQLQPADDADQARIWMRALINLALVEAGPGGDASRAIALYDRVEQSLQGVSDATLSSAQATSGAQALFNRAVLHYERRGDADSAAEDYRRIVARFAPRHEPDVMLTVAHALSNHAWLLANVHRNAGAAVALYLQLDQRFGDRRDREIALLAASALFAAAVLTARELRAAPAALDLYRRIVVRHELTADPAFVALVAKSLFNVGALLGAHPETHAQAIDAYDALIERCAGSDDPQLAEWAAGGLVNSAALQLRGGDMEGARVSYTRTVQAFSASREPGAAEQVARAQFNLAGIASQQGDVAAAIRAYNELQQHAQGNETLRHEQILARGLANLAQLQANTRQDTALALRAFGQLLDRFRERDEPGIAEQGARALLGVGVLNASRRQDYTAAVAAYDDLATRYGHRSEPQIAITVAKGLFNLATLQARQLHDLRATLVTLNRLIDRFTGYQEAEVEVRVVSGLLTRARVFDRLAEPAAARETCSDLVARYSAHADPRVQKYVEAARRMFGTKATEASARPPAGEPQAGAREELLPH